MAIHRPIEREWANIGKADDVLFFDVIFSILLVAFGAGLGVANVSTFQTIQSPKLAPTPNGQIQNCQNTDAGCIASNLALATAYVGWAIVNLPILLIFFAQIIIVFANSVFSTVFSPTLNLNGVPYLGLAFVGLQFYVIWEIIRTFRGSSTGI